MGNPAALRHLESSGTVIEKLPDETDDICLDLFVRRVGEEVGDPARAWAVVLPEIPLQSANSLVCRRVAEQWLQTGGDVADAGSVVAHEVVQIVGVLVFSAKMEGEGLEHHVGPGSAYPHRSRRLLTDDRRTRNRDLFAVHERKMKSRGDDRGKIRLDIAQRTAAITGKARRNQKVDGDLLPCLNLPALPGWISLFGCVLFKPRVAQPLGKVR